MTDALPAALPDTLRAALRARRRELGLSQAELAARAGVSQATVSRLERGRDDVRLALVRKLLEAVDLRLEVRDAAGREYPSVVPPWITATDTGGALLPAHLDLRLERLMPLRTFLRRMGGHGNLLGPDDVWVYSRRAPRRPAEEPGEPGEPGV